eukprot:GEZU01013771.1.p1 GENE.GEZU01013771.1~~GEZU01013771.1.p1  ORF type:complete len:229 (+),score=79.03 GEZU01013771.1:113-799(+)
MAKKVLFVVTNHDQLGNTGKKTGWYLPEVAHPYQVLKRAGFQIDFVSPNGGHAPVDPGSVTQYADDEESKEFLADEVAKKAIEATLRPDQVRPSDYAAIMYAGGHGPCWDIPDNEAIASIAAQIYEAGGVVSAVCHGPIGLVNIKLSNGDYLVKGKTVTGFTDAEEEIVKLTDVVPFSLEQRLKERSANFTAASPWAAHVESDQRLVTGQNPASAKPMAEEVAKLLQQ